MKTKALAPELLQGMDAWVARRELPPDANTLLVADVIDRVPALGPRTAYVKQAVRDKLIENKHYITRTRRGPAGDPELAVGRKEMIGTSKMDSRFYLIRHGETAWALSGQPTGRTDIPLTEQGEKEARELTERLQAVRFSRVPNFWQTA